MKFKTFDIQKELFEFVKEIEKNNIKINSVTVEPNYYYPHWYSRGKLGSISYYLNFVDSNYEKINKVFSMLYNIFPKNYIGGGVETNYFHFFVQL